MATRFGVIGTGVWGETHLKAYSEDPLAELACICDKDEKLVRRRARQYKPQKWTTDYRELLADDTIAAVSIVTPDPLHREVAIAAAEAGKHILVEKPLATTVEDCEAIIAAAKKNKVKLMVDFHNRFNTPFTETRAAIDAGEIGEPQLIVLRLNDTIYVPTKMLSWAGKSTVAWFLCSHATDLVRWLFDDDVKRVYSVARSKVLKGLGINTPDFFVTTLEMRKGGVANIENCWIMSDRMPTIFDFKMELVGEKGTLFADVSSHRMLQKFSKKEAVYPDVHCQPDVHGKTVGFTVEAIHYWVRCVVEDLEPLVTGQDGLEVTKVICAIEESVRTGQPVDL